MLNLAHGHQPEILPETKNARVISTTFTNISIYSLAPWVTHGTLFARQWVRVSSGFAGGGRIALGAVRPRLGVPPVPHGKEKGPRHYV